MRRNNVSLFLLPLPLSPHSQLTPPPPLAGLPLLILRLPLPLRRHHRRNNVHPPLPTNLGHANGVYKEQTEFREDCELVGGLDAFYRICYVVCVFFLFCLVFISEFFFSLFFFLFFILT